VTDIIQYVNGTGQTVGTSSTDQEIWINYGKSLQIQRLIIMSPNDPFPLLVNRPQITHPWTNLGGILEQVHQGHPCKFITQVNKIERLHSTEASNGPLIEMGWKPGNHVLKGSGKSLSAPDPGR